MHLAIAAFVLDARGDRGTAGRYLQLVRWLEETEERLDPVLSLWQARLLARRGAHAEARALLERPALAEDRRGRDEMLEAWCEVISEEGAWDEAPSSPRERAPCIVGGRASPRLVRRVSTGEPPLRGGAGAGDRAPGIGRGRVHRRSGPNGRRRSPDSSWLAH